MSLVEKTLLGAGFVLAAIVGVLYLEHLGAARERMHHLTDSLALVQHQLDSTTSLVLASAARAREGDSLAALRLHAKDVVIAQTRRLAIALRDSLRATLDSSQQVDLDSLEALHSIREASLSSQRDSALALFSRAASARDTLAALLRSSQAQTQALSVALVQAQRVPFFSRPSVRIGMLAGAFLAGNLLSR